MKFKSFLENSFKKQKNALVLEISEFSRNSKYHNFMNFVLTRVGLLQFYLSEHGKNVSEYNV